MPFMLDETESFDTNPNETQPDPPSDESHNHRGPSDSEGNEDQPDPAIAKFYDDIVRSEQRVGLMVDIASFDNPIIRNIVEDEFVDSTGATFDHKAALQRRITALVANGSHEERVLWDYYDITWHTQPSRTPDTPRRAKAICCLASDLAITSDKDCECGCGKVDYECEEHGKRFRVIFFVDDEPSPLERRTPFRSEVMRDGRVTLDRRPGFEDLRAWDRALVKADRYEWGYFCWKVLWERAAASLEEAVEVKLRWDSEHWV